MTTTTSETSNTRQPLERRGLPEAARLQDRAEGPMLTGYAVRFNERSEPMHGANGAEFVEEVIPGALARLRERRDVKALIGHDPTKVIGSTRSGTLTLIPDAIGLRFELQPPNSPTGHDLIESVRRGDLDGVSFGFRTIADKWLPDTRPPVRQLLDVDVFELSIVAWPAYREAGVIIEPRALEYAAELVTCESRQLRARELDALTVRLRAIR